MDIQFEDDQLRRLCDDSRALDARFNSDGSTVRRRLLVLSVAKELGDVTTQPPDRRRAEPALGPHSYSVYVSVGLRIYFDAEVRNGDAPEAARSIKIFRMG